MQYSVVNFNDVNLGNRIDAEYFQPTYLHIENKLIEKHATPLRGFCYITGSAFYPAATHLYETGDIPFIRCVDCISYPIITSRQDELFEKIPQAFADEHQNIKRLTKGEIVITKVGTPCYASIIHDINDVALSRTVLGLKHIKIINPYYLVVFLRSKYGFLQLFRERELTIQFQLTLDRVGNVLVFKPINKFLEELIADCFLFHEELKRKFENLFNDAENLVLEELGLSNWQPKHQLTFLKNYSDACKAERIDAEYFQPKYDEIVKAVKDYAGGWDTLGNLVSMKKCVEVGSEAYIDEGDVPFIRVSNFSPFELTEEKYISNELYAELSQHQPQKGEILFSKDATPGIACHLKETPKKMIPSGGILRLKVKNKQINEDYLTLVLNSLIVKEQINRDVGGSVILHWRPEQVRETLIPILPEDKQSQIQQKITKSFNLRKQSKHLLECAKRAVEISIEQNEDAAIKWLQEQTEDAGDGAEAGAS
jgi:restriction endonuclease S subunit